VVQVNETFEELWDKVALKHAEIYTVVKEELVKLRQAVEATKFAAETLVSRRRRTAKPKKEVYA